MHTAIIFQTHQTRPVASLQAGFAATGKKGVGGIDDLAQTDYNLGGG
ncbi:hypothetical protein [Kamptonema formosum]|nr:hypothetical protein [Oscillatoria sp. PCC 10802]